MIVSKGKINSHVSASGTRRFLVSILKRMAKIEPGGEPFAVTQAKATPHTSERAGCVVYHAARIVVIAYPAKIKENKRPNVKAPQVDKRARIGTKSFQIEKSAEITHNFPFTIAAHTDDPTQRTARAAYAELLPRDKRIGTILCGYPPCKAETRGEREVAEAKKTPDSIMFIRPLARQAEFPFAASAYIA